MKIEDLKETVQLAHLNMDEGELAASFPAFEQMLGFFAAMQAADEDRAAFPEGSLTGDAAPVSGLSGASQTVTSQHFRPDNSGNNLNNQPNTPPYDPRDNKAVKERLVSDMLHNAGERDGRFVVVPNVL
ncbi:MAG: aspartyl/glutamyl-tRNA amidotransferase subunit C [Treponema sp.]|jgi:aspartyl-tRNA(Asn)/glutamyl-tRNA(Gln) amidotransferase subunit C|nr:aspartyl/glutamyl-tRNA amidotransferase subunit C [Treponema sp.]